MPQIWRSSHWPEQTQKLLERPPQLNNLETEGKRYSELRVAGTHLGTRDSNFAREANRSRWSLGSRDVDSRMPQRVSPPWTGTQSPFPL